MRTRDLLLGLSLAGLLAAGCTPPPAIAEDRPPSHAPVVVTAAAATTDALTSDVPPVPAPTSAASGTAAGPSEQELPPGVHVPAGVGYLHPFESVDDTPTRLRFAHATSQGIVVHLGRTMDLGVDFNYVEQRKPKIVAALGSSPPIDILPSVPVDAPAEAEGTWEVFDGGDKLCEGKLEDVRRATYLRNLDGDRSMACQEVAEGLGRPLSRAEIAEFHAIAGGFAGEVTGRIRGCKAPTRPTFLWARPAGSGPAPQEVRSWTSASTAIGRQLYARTTESSAWRALAAPVEEEYAKALPGAEIPRRTSIGRRDGAPNGLPGWSIWAQLGNTFGWTGKTTAVAETTLWNLYPEEPHAAPWTSTRVSDSLEVQMVASGQLGDGVELVAMARTQCHDVWMLLGRNDKALTLRRGLTVSCWCSD